MGLARCIAEGPGRMLLIGAGGGSVVKDFAAEGWGVDAVEIDPVVVEMAREHFGLADSEARVFVMDGRQFLISHDERYDLIAMDAFGSSSIPFHLVTQEVFGLIASRLKPGGLLAINLESNGWDGPVVKAVAATLKPHFGEVLALPAEPSRKDLGNVVLFASNSPLELRPDPEGKPNGRFDCEGLLLEPRRESRLEPEIRSRHGGRAGIDRRSEPGRPVVGGHEPGGPAGSPQLLQRARIELLLAPASANRAGPKAVPAQG